MDSLKDLEQKKQKLLDELKQINKDIDVRLSQTVVRCSNKDCGRGYEIRELEYIQTHWYVEPYSCTGGDIWHEGEGQWSCPQCGYLNRLYNSPDIMGLRKLFKSESKSYDRN